jgi:hypothetical protein
VCVCVCVCVCGCKLLAAWAIRALGRFWGDTLPAETFRRHLASGVPFVTGSLVMTSDLHQVKQKALWQKCSLNRSIACWN